MNARAGWAGAGRAGLLITAALLAHQASAQTVTEKLLGEVVLQGTPGPGLVVSHQGDRFARRERVPAGGERYVSLAGAGETFDKLLPGATWVDGRLVYYAQKSGQTLLIDGSRRLVLQGKPTSPLVAGRPWPSRDGRHYAAFVSDGKRIGWYLDGQLQGSRFDRLGAVNITAASASVMFAAATGCDWRLVGHAPSAAARWDMLNWVQASEDGIHRSEEASEVACERRVQGGLPL